MKPPTNAHTAIDGSVNFWNFQLSIGDGLTVGTTLAVANANTADVRYKRQE